MKGSDLMPKEYNKRTLIYDWSHVPIIMDVAYVANLLGLTYEYTRRMCKRGEIPAYKVGEQSWRINKSDLMKFVGLEATA